MKNNLVAGAVGFLFALGLGISGMLQPAKVLAFLDIFGAWDPSLLFVMAGAIGLHAPLYRLARGRATPVFSPEWHVPTSREITGALVVGSFLFGVGWGLAGFCPGPALVSLFVLQREPVYFFLGLLLGMISFRVLNARFPLRR
jgi:uncharacterized membrane protein YedE/YeeE